MLDDMVYYDQFSGWTGTNVLDVPALPKSTDVITQNHAEMCQQIYLNFLQQALSSVRGVNGSLTVLRLPR
jgi:hypothetical protein